MARSGPRVAVRAVKRQVSVRPATRDRVNAAAAERGVSARQVVDDALNADPDFAAYQPELGGEA